MAKREKTAKSHKRPIEQYDHRDKKRTNNPPVGLVTAQTDPPVTSGKIYTYDPHLDPQLIWAGKTEHTSFKVPTVSLHVHERIDPRTIIEAVRRRNGNGRPIQGFLFESKDENPPLREAIDFYRHPHDWSNRLVAGDSLLVMNSLLEKEGMAGQVQMVYIDPPYGIKYGSNFQAFVNRRDVKDRKDEDLTQEPETIRAFRDTWELGIHSYLTYLRDRLMLARELLHESGSCFVQISDQNVHHVRELMDEVLGSKNFLSQIAFRTSGSLSADVVSGIYDILLWYGLDATKTKIRPLFVGRDIEDYQFVELPDGGRKSLSEFDQLPERARVFTTENLVSSGYTRTCIFPIEFEGRIFNPSSGKSWKTTEEGIERLKRANRLQAFGSTVRYILYYDDYPVSRLTNLWVDLAGAPDKIFVVQTNPKVVQRCLLMTTDPGDLVFDPSCGSGTTAFVAEQWGRRWITCDTSRVSIALAKQRLMTALYDYYELAHPEEGVGSGFRYRKVPHVTLGSIAQNEPPGEETLFDQPLVDNSRARVTGPFTMEAVPAPTVRSLEDIESTPYRADASIARSGPTVRQAEWRDELLKTGIRGKAGQIITFSRVEPLGGTHWVHADAETKERTPQRVIISFGPEYAPLEQRQVEMAWEEARTLIPKPSIIIFAAFQFDPEAAKDIGELTKEKTGMTFLTAQMNADLLTEDLKKKRTSNESFWLVGQPDVVLRKIKRGEERDLWEAEVHGFDYYNTINGSVESGAADQIAVWMLDTDYDGRSLLPRQVFFPMAGPDEGWTKLAKNLKAEIDEELIEAYRGTTSLPFKLGKHSRVGVKIVDARGIESLKIIPVE
jgi:adenine-specific DNA-methyltransferase